MHRRDFLNGLLATSFTVPFSTVRPMDAQSVVPPTALPDPGQSGIDHIVVVTMENRSFDHLLGWLPGADGVQSGLTYLDRNGRIVGTYPLPPDYTGCGHPNPDHSYEGGRAEYNNGAMDGFLMAGRNDEYAVGFYSAADMPFLAALAQHYRAYDRWFSAFLGPSIPNRIFQWSGQTDRLDQSLSITRFPTIFDRLANAGVSHRYYFSNLPVLALWAFRYFFASSHISDFFDDAATGRLPAVSFVDPAFSSVFAGVGNDYEAPSDIRNGEAFLSQVFQALATGPRWPKTVLIINFDEWGGFFDHVRPPRVTAPNSVDADVVNGNVLLGLRIPVVIASPFTADRKIDHTAYDNTSVLKLIEWRWKLAPLTSRDASTEIGNPAVTFNFQSPDASMPAVPQALPVPALPCLQTLLSRAEAESAASTFPKRSHTDESNNNGFTEFARTAVVQQWLNHPRFNNKIGK